MARKKRKREKQGPNLALICNEFFLLGLQISQGNIELPDCESFKRRVLMLFETMRAKANKAGILATDVDYACFALAAYLDEMIQYSSWPAKQEWSANPLQAIMFGESKAGARFFQRLQEVASRSPEALEVYYYCLVLGFMGEYRLGGHEAYNALIEDVRRELTRSSGKKLSVHGMRPDEGPRIGGKSLPFLPIAGACILLSTAVILLLYLFLTFSSSEATELLEKLGRG